MIIIIISECSKKALPRTRKILSSYFWQVGRRTWIGKISEEGLNDVQTEIRKSATRQTSVCFWKVSGRKKYELISHTGNKKRINEKGLYAWSIKKTNPFERVDVIKDNNVNLNVMECILSFAALFHDLGKGTLGFQNKLKATNTLNAGDPVRHEVISCWILDAVFNGIQKAIGENKNWLEVFSSTNKLKEVFEQFAQAGLTKKAESKGIKNQLIPWNTFLKLLPVGEKNQFPIIVKNSLSIQEMILWLVLSHHKLPEGSFNSHLDEQGILNLQKVYSNENERNQNNYNKFVSEFVKLAEGEQPWQNNEWLKKVSDTANSLTLLLKKIDIPQFEKDILPAMFIILRPSLILGDFNGSARKEEKKDGDPSIPSKKTVYANTMQKKFFCDSLPTHLLKVEEDSAIYFKIFKKIIENNHNFPTVKFEGQKPNYDKPTPFTWQDDFSEKILEFRKQNNCNSPFFCALFAGTGSGKTIGIVKTMQAVAIEPGQARFSLGLGLKSLATQTAHEYWDQNGIIKLKKEDLMVFIGDRIARNEAERILTEGDFKNKEAYDPESEGTTNSISEKERIEILNAFEGGTNEVLSEIKKLQGLSEKDKLILSTPITVGTIDHFVPGSELLRGTDAGMSLRLATSDFAIDEIDSFSFSDLPALQRVVYFSGFFGRSVLLSSASMSEFSVSTFFNVWKMGVSAGNLIRSQKILKLNYAIASENYHISFVESADINDNDKFKISLYKFLNLQINYLNQLPPRKIIEKSIEPIFNNQMDNHSKICAWFDTIKINAVKFHSENSNNLNLNNKNYKISTGFVKFNTTHAAQSFALWLSSQPISKKDDICFAVVCYHSKFIRIDRSIIEEYLDKNLKWKQKDGYFRPNIFEDKALQNFINNNSKYKNICVLVSTTSIQETGRDHDYDWAILDPSSLRSFIQAAGRVRRHRREEYHFKNIALLKKPSQIWMKSNTKLNESDINTPKSVNDPWSFPGLGDYRVFKKPVFHILKQLPKDKESMKNDIWKSSNNDTSTETKRTREKLLEARIEFIEGKEEGFIDADTFLNTAQINKIDAKDAYFCPNKLKILPARCYSEILEQWYMGGFQDNTWSGNNILSNFISRLFLTPHKNTEFRQSALGETSKRSSMQVYTKNEKEIKFYLPFEGKFWEIIKKYNNIKNSYTSLKMHESIDDIKESKFEGNPAYFLLKMPKKELKKDIEERLLNYPENKREEIRDSLEIIELDSRKYKEKKILENDLHSNAVYIREIGLYWPII